MTLSELTYLRNLIKYNFKLSNLELHLLLEIIQNEIERRNSKLMMNNIVGN